MTWKNPFKCVGRGVQDTLLFSSFSSEDLEDQLIPITNTEAEVSPKRALVYDRARLGRNPMWHMDELETQPPILLDRLGVTKQNGVLLH
jgi:hypothetical protein